MYYLEAKNVKKVIINAFAFTDESCSRSSWKLVGSRWITYSCDLALSAFSSL